MLEAQQRFANTQLFSPVLNLSVSSCSQSRSPGAVGCVSSRSDSPDATPSSTASSSSPKAPSFLFRVLRTALFIQLLLLFLIGLACMVPMTEEDYSCHYANNFARSFHPMLRYMNGPPPIWEGAKKKNLAKASTDSCECFLDTLCPKSTDCYMNDVFH